jgi:transcriptional regulator with XRE-family HTH domain
MNDTSATATVFCQLRPLIYSWQAANEKRLTFDELAARTGVSDKTLRQWAKGDVSMYSARVLAALCSFFGVTVGDILIFDNGESEQEKNHG